MSGIDEAVKLVRAYYAKPGNEAGGNLHVMLDDGNMWDACLEVCEEAAREENDVDGLEIIRLLRPMSEAEREQVYERK